MSEASEAPSRRQRTRQATIAAILEAARAQMRAEGAAALNLNEVARQVGMRPPSLYEYFPGGKHAIYDALFRLGYELYGALIERLATINDPWEAQQLAAETYFSFAANNPELYQLCFERPVPGFVPSEASLELSFGILSQGRAHFERVLAPLASASGMSAEQYFNLTIALTHGITALHLANEPHLPLGEGRFGSLVPFVAAILRRVWSAEPDSPATSEGAAP
jgi:AcrR family transcriptional regulator